MGKTNKKNNISRSERNFKKTIHNIKKRKDKLSQRAEIRELINYNTTK